MRSIQRRRQKIIYATCFKVIIPGFIVINIPTVGIRLKLLPKKSNEPIFTGGVPAGRFIYSLVLFAGLANKVIASSIHLT